LRQKFLDSNTVGFDMFRDYVLGVEDGVPKTPSWAEAITGVPESVIERLAVEYATTSPAALIPGWAPARGARGEQFSRAANTIIAMTGNIGVPGGCAGGLMRPDVGVKMELPTTLPNAVDRDAPPRRESLFGTQGAANVESTRIHGTKVYDAILRGRAGGYPCDPKLAYVVARNVLDTHLNVNKGISAFKSLEFIVVQEQRMTPTARYADILLPVNTSMERDDVIQPWLGAPYSFFMNRAINPMFEAMSDREICAQLASRLGISDFAEGRTDEEALAAMVEGASGVQDSSQFRREGIARAETERPFIAFGPQVQDPVRNPFPTPSGKIEIYSERLAEMNNPEISPVPRYLPSPEGHEDAVPGKYPLQILSAHHFSGTHTTLEGIPWLDEAGPRRLWINTRDAVRRGISNGDSVLVFNDRGKVLVQVEVTERIMPGVVNLPHGGWSAFDENGVDRGACANVLTSSEHSPGGAWSVNTTRVEVTKS
jgi:anaerobic dimethyl sulfoxide reductase subunit A